MHRAIVRKSQKTERKRVSTQIFGIFQLILSDFAHGFGTASRQVQFGWKIRMPAVGLADGRNRGWVPDFAYGEGGAVRMTAFTRPRTREDLNADHVALQPSGKMLVFEGLSARFEQNHGVARLNANGSVDTSFGANGWVSMPQADRDTDCLFRDKTSAAHPDGSFLMRDSSDLTLRTLARFSVDGRRDASFAPDLP
jgi:hypothetical protein